MKEDISQVTYMFIDIMQLIYICKFPLLKKSSAIRLLSHSVSHLPAGGRIQLYIREQLVIAWF